jgi:hypothetical protein
VFEIRVQMHGALQQFLWAAQAWHAVLPGEFAQRSNDLVVSAGAARRVLFCGAVRNRHIYKLPCPGINRRIPLSVRVIDSYPNEDAIHFRFSSTNAR